MERKTETVLFVHLQTKLYLKMCLQIVCSEMLTLKILFYFHFYRHSLIRNSHRVVLSLSIYDSHLLPYLRNICLFCVWVDWWSKDWHVTL